MTDRDKFAAAALTGLIVSMREESMYEVCESAYGWADAMLRERDGVTKPMPDVPSGGTSVRLWGSEREAIEECVKLIAKTKQHDAMPKGPFMYWKHRKEALLELLERTK